MRRFPGAWAAMVITMCGCRSPAPVEKPPTPVKVVRVEARTEQSSARYSANIEPETRVDAAFRVGGYVTDIAQVRGHILQEGDTV
ncbi:MAG: hypothetical protein JO022_16160, partial [Acidobacteriaceae bacterium]|nr:hypothetical protein [Acidobacteriaceae bacterium]